MLQIMPRVVGGAAHALAISAAATFSPETGEGENSWKKYSVSVLFSQLTSPWLAFRGKVLWTFKFCACR